MKRSFIRLFALLLALLLAFPMAAQALDLSSLFGDDFTQNGGINLIDNEEDEEDEEEEPAADEVVSVQQETPVVTNVPAPVVLPDASADTSRIRDDADLFTTAEEAQIAQRIAQFQQNTGCDFVVMTANRSHDGISAQQLADEFYDYGGYGLDAENSGIGYLIDMYERYHYITTTGVMIDYMTDERIDSAINSSTSYLSSRRYADGVLYMIDTVERYYRAGIPEGQYQYDVLTGQVLTARHKALTGGEILLCAIIGVVVAAIFYGSVHGSYKLKGSTYSYQVAENSTLNMTDTEDTYTHTTTTRVRKPDPPRSSGGGFSGGGGSGVHVGSSGASHGGGGGRF
ncbi:MAG: TPM domain-containing protein [Clostridiales bacterium]|nr:TPM domain-containing protein [Clostridiales bacterium]